MHRCMTASGGHATDDAACTNARHQSSFMRPKSAAAAVARDERRRFPYLLDRAQAICVLLGGFGCWRICTPEPCSVLRVPASDFGGVWPSLVRSHKVAPPAHQESRSGREQGGKRSYSHAREQVRCVSAAACAPSAGRNATNSKGSRSLGAQRSAVATAGSGGTIRHASPCIQRAPEVERPALWPGSLRALSALTVAGLHRASSLALALSRVMPCASHDTWLQLSTSAGASGRQLLRAEVMHTFRRKQDGCNRRMPPRKVMNPDQILFA